MAPLQTDPLWDRIPDHIGKKLVWTLWFATWIGLLAGLINQVFYDYVVWFSAAHACLFWTMFRFRAAAFPVQVRLAYFVWVAAGAYIPYMTILLYITMVGLATNLFLGYCPLARIMYLMPWNRQEPFSSALVLRVFFTPPVQGPFRPVDNWK
jgi:hypothetical protein